MVGDFMTDTSEELKKIKVDKNDIKLNFILTDKKIK